MNVINLITNILIVVIFVLVVVFSYKILNIIWGKRDEIILNINRSISKNTSMTYKEMRLSKMGIMYRMKNYNLTPADYIIFRIAIGIAGAVLFFIVGSAFLFRPFYLIPIGFLAGYFGVMGYMTYENKVDNEEMVMDIYNTYANIKIQMSAGIYIREVLEYTYKMVQNERYKQALAELILNFSDKTISSSQAVLLFKNRFSSIEIDKLSAMLESFMQYGINQDHADDIMAEIQGLIQAETIKTEHDIETMAASTNFAFFAGIIAMVVFVVFSSFSMGGLF